MDHHRPAQRSTSDSVITRADLDYDYTARRFSDASFFSTGTYLRPLPQFDRSRAHFRQNYHEVKFLGEGDNGETHAAISKADTAAVLADHHPHTEPFYKAIRSKLVAVKFAKDQNCEGDLTNEILFLTQTITASHPNVISCIDSFLKRTSQWLAMPFCSGGTLQDFVCDIDHLLGASFTSYVGLQAASAVAFLHFGIKDTADMTPAQGWPTVFHGDIFAGNVLVRPATSNEPGFRGFPNIVLADFGRAKQIGENASNDEIGEYRSSQAADIRGVSSLMGECKYCPGYGYPRCFSHLDEPSDDRCRDCLPCAEEKRKILAKQRLDEWVGRLEQPSSFEDPSSELTLLTDFVEAAEAMRADHYEDLPVEALAKLNSVKISNDVLDKALGLC